MQNTKNNGTLMAILIAHTVKQVCCHRQTHAMQCLTPMHHAVYDDSLCH